MPRYRITLDDGSSYEIEADREPTKEEVVAFMGQGSTLSGGATAELKPQTGFEAPMRLDASALTGGDAGEMTLDLPSPEEFVGFLPDVAGAAGGAAGAAVGHPAKGGAVGSMFGEVAKQLINEKFGKPAAPGVVQEMLDLDPEGLPARGLGVLAEGATGLGFETLGKILGKRVAPALKRRGVSGYAELAQPGSLREKKEIIKRLMPIADDLPMGTARGMRDKTERKLVTAMEDQKTFMEEFGDEPIRGGTERVSKALREAAEENIETGARTNLRETVPVPSKKGKQVVFDEGAGTGYTEEFEILPEIEEIAKNRRTRRGPITDPKPINVGLDKALRAEGADVTERRLLREGSAEGPETANDLLKSRRQADREVIQSQTGAMALSKQQRDVVDKAQAKLIRRTALKETLHDPEAWSQAGELMKKDEMITAWSTINEAVQNDEASHFLARWGLSRLIGGIPGTAAGLAAGGGMTALRTVKSKTWINIAKLLEKGDDTGAEYLLRNALRPETGEDNDTE
jgi:hypothetical protein